MNENIRSVVVKNIVAVKIAKLRICSIKLKNEKDFRVTVSTGNMARLKSTKHCFNISSFKITSSYSHVVLLENIVYFGEMVYIK